MRTQPHFRSRARVSLRRILFVLAAASLAPSGDIAQAAPGDAGAPDPCAMAADEAAMLACRTREKNTTEAALRRVAERLLRGYQRDEPALAKLFAEAQRRWEAFREAECKALTYESVGSAGYAPYLNDCLAAMNRERLRALKRREDSP